MFNNLYLFFIDYLKTLLTNPILKGIELTFFILLWQVLGIFLVSFVRDISEPLRKRMNLEVNYFALSFAAVTGLFLPLYLALAFESNKIHSRVFRTIAIFGCAVLLLIPSSLILGAGVIIPVYSVIMWGLNLLIGILPILGALAIIMPVVFFGGILSIVGMVVGRI